MVLDNQISIAVEFQAI